MLLDTAALYFRAFYGVPDTVHGPNGMPVNAIRGLLDIIARLVSEFQPTEIVACWDDSWRPQWRVDLIPTYKAHRVAEVAGASSSIEDVPDLLTPQVAVIRAGDYLAVAPTVVKVVRDLELPEFDARIRACSDERTAELDRLSVDWGLGSSMKRAQSALGALAT
ncbi:hypothetical protein [Glaciihabitans sp. UYNi722]|uniref:hypothetical protein n=1 Tax=Glaciihabitans sp. UYNi722 TaxID=3156344 RepID=UPI003392C8DE